MGVVTKSESREKPPLPRQGDPHQGGAAPLCSILLLVQSMMGKENRKYLNKDDTEVILKILMFEGHLQPSYCHI
jgi:hypothetical protein